MRDQTLGMINSFDCTALLVINFEAVHHIMDTCGVGPLICFVKNPDQIRYGQKIYIYIISGGRQKKLGGGGLDARRKLKNIFEYL